MAMSTQRRRWLACAAGWLAAIALSGGMRSASAKVPAQANNLILTLEKGQGLSHVIESITPVAPSGSAAGSASAIYDVVGDLRIQFRFIAVPPEAEVRPAEIRDATFAELRALGLQPEQAVRKALANMARLWVLPPTAARLIEAARSKGRLHSGGIVDTIVIAVLPLVGGSWMMDRSLWTEATEALGPIVVTAARQGVAYAPLRDVKAMEWMEANHGNNVRVGFALSNQLYIFEKRRWAVFAKQAAR